MPSPLPNYGGSALCSGYISLQSLRGGPVAQQAAPAKPHVKGL
jgi:hypothetical protein